MLFIIVLEIIGLIISCIVFGVTGSTIGFIICGVFFVLMITLKLFVWLVEDHPIFLEFLYLISAVACAIISISIHSVWPIVICELSIGFLKGSYAMAGANTDWYDTDYFTIDGALYSYFDSDRSNFIMGLGVLVFIALYGLLILPFIIFKIGFLAFIPAIFFLIRFIRGIVASR